MQTVVHADYSPVCGIQACKGAQCFPHGTAPALQITSLLSTSSAWTSLQSQVIALEFRFIWVNRLC